MFSFSFEADPQTNWRKRRLFRNLIRKAKKLLFLMRYRISEKIKCENDFEIVICHQAVVSVIISKIHIWKKVAHEKWPPPLFEKWSFGTLFSILSFLHRVGQLLFYGLMGSKFRRQERPNYVRELRRAALRLQRGMWESNKKRERPHWGQLSDETMPTML